MYQKVSNNQIFLFEIWGDKGYLSPAPAAFNLNKEKWKVKGVFGGKSFEIEIGEEHVGKDKIGAEIPVHTTDKTIFEISFTRNEESDSMSGTTKYL